MGGDWSFFKKTYFKQSAETTRDESFLLYNY
jgi:hypothetical protein